jgi:hypothetical protein
MITSVVFIIVVLGALLAWYIHKNKQLTKKVKDVEQERDEIREEYYEPACAWNFHASHSAIPIEEVPVGGYSFNVVMGEGYGTYFALRRYHNWGNQRVILVQGNIRRAAEESPLEQRFGETIFDVIEDENGVRHYSMQFLDEVSVYSPKY